MSLSFCSVEITILFRFIMMGAQGNFRKYSKQNTVKLLGGKRKNKPYSSRTDDNYNYSIEKLL
jgi:hypothetical protein